MVDNDSLDHVAQQFLLVTARQRFIQYTQFCNDGQRIIQIINVALTFLVEQLQTGAQLVAFVLPFRPQITPVFLCDHLRCIQTQHTCLFFINLLEGTFKLGALIRAQPSELVGHFADVVVTDAWDERRINLNRLKMGGKLALNFGTEKMNRVAFQTIMGGAAAGAPRIGCGAGQPVEPRAGQGRIRG